MCEPKPNNCELEFICSDKNKKECYQYKGEQFCKFYKGPAFFDEDSEPYCENAIAQVNAAVIYLKSQLGDENVRNMLKEFLNRPLVSREFLENMQANTIELLSGSKWKRGTTKKNINYIESLEKDLKDINKLLEEKWK